MNKINFRYKKISDLIPYKNNARTHSLEQLQQIADSIKQFGFVSPVILHKGNQIVAGHGRVEAAKLIGLDEIPTINADYLTENQKKAYIIADNRLAELAGWDDEILKNEIIALNDCGFDIETTGFTLDDVKIELEDDGNNEKDDEVPEPPKTPKTQLGDLIELGNHRILCGDCTDKDNLNKLMGGDRADMVFTDPPYSSGGFQEAGKAVGSVGTRQNIKIANDNLSTRGYKTLINQMLSVVMAETLLMFGDWRMWIENFDLAEKNGFRVRNMIVWNKNSMGMGRPFRNQHELILFGSRENVKYEISKVANVLSFNRCKNELHPTQKPIELLETVLSNFDINISQTIVEPFLGSGSTLIACEKTGRKCYGMDLVPKYCDVIIKRWCDFTGKSSFKVNGVTKSIKNY